VAGAVLVGVGEEDCPPGERDGVGGQECADRDPSGVSRGGLAASACEGIRGAPGSTNGRNIIPVVDVR